MKSKGKVIVPIVLAAAVLVITGVVIYQHPLPGMEGWYPQKQETQPTVTESSGAVVASLPEVETQSDTIVPGEQEQEVSSGPIDSFAINPEKTFELGQTFEEDDMTGKYEITIEDASLSKDLQGHPQEAFVYYTEGYKDPENNEVIDENGNFVSQHSYLFVKMRIENITDHASKPCMTNIRLQPIDANGKAGLSALDPSVRFIDKNSSKINDRDEFYFLEIEPHEKMEVVLGYCIHEKELIAGEKLFLHFNLAGMGMAEGESDIYYYPVVDLKLP